MWHCAAACKERVASQEARDSGMEEKASARPAWLRRSDRPVWALGSGEHFFALERRGERGTEVEEQDELDAEIGRAHAIEPTALADQYHEAGAAARAFEGRKRYTARGRCRNGVIGDCGRGGQRCVLR